MRSRYIYTFATSPHYSRKFISLCALLHSYITCRALAVTFLHCVHIDCDPSIYGQFLIINHLASHTSYIRFLHTKSHYTTLSLSCSYSSNKTCWCSIINVWLITRCLTRLLRIHSLNFYLSQFRPSASLWYSLVKLRCFRKSSTWLRA